MTVLPANTPAMLSTATGTLEFAVLLFLRCPLALKPHTAATGMGVGSAAAAGADQCGRGQCHTRQSREW